MEDLASKEWIAETLTEHLLAKLDPDSTTSNARKSRKSSRVQEHRAKQLTRVIHDAFPFWRDYRHLVQRLYQLSKASWSVKSEGVEEGPSEKGSANYGGPRKQGVHYPELRGGLIKTFKLLGQFEAAQTLRLQAAKGFAIMGGRLSLEATMLRVLEDSLYKIARVNGFTQKEAEDWVGEGATETSKLLRELRPDFAKCKDEAVTFMVDFLLPQVTAPEYKAEMTNWGEDRGEKRQSGKRGSGVAGFERNWDRNARLHRPENEHLPSSGLTTRATQILKTTEWR